MQYQKYKKWPFVQLKVIVNTACDINSAKLIEQNENVQDSSSVTLKSVILK